MREPSLEALPCRRPLPVAIMLTSNQTLSFALVRTASPPHPAALAPSALSTTGTAIEKVFSGPREFP